MERAILIDVIVDRAVSPEESMLRLDELESLVKTYGGISVLKTYQRRSEPNYRTFVGEGKIDELLKELGGAPNVDVIIINNILKPRQIFNLEEHCTNFEIARLKEEGRFETPKKIKVWDRVDLILKIFDKHAKSAEAKLQIELASIKHMGPRIFGMGLELSRQAGGIGGVGIGETNTEIMKRHLKTRTKLIEEKIEKYGDIQSRQRESRRSRKQKTVAVAGYTNAGKSTLIKALTKKQEVYIADELFATLDSKVGELYLPNLYKTVMVADTIGFIQDLPPDLIDAFKTTLAEIVEADIILHVIDINDPNLHFKICVVEDILKEILKEEKQKIYVFNKVDLLNAQPWDERQKEDYKKNLLEKYAEFTPQIVSALDHESLLGLIETIENKVKYL